LEFRRVLFRSSLLLNGIGRVDVVAQDGLFARIVKEKALLRNVIHATYAIQQQALEAEEDADAILDRAESTIFQLAEDRARAGFVGVKDLVRENFDRLARILTEGRRVTGLSTGYNQLNNITSGL